MDPEKIVNNMIRKDTTSMNYKFANDKGTEIGGYTYYTSEAEAVKHLKKKGDAVAHEGGLGWYVYNKIEYAQNPVKRIVGF